MLARQTRQTHFRNDQLNLFYVLLECENKDCEFLIGKNEF